MSDNQISLKEYFDKQIEWLKTLSDEREKRYQERFIAQQEAIKIADDRMREVKDSAITNAEHNLLQAQVNRIELRIGEDKGVHEGISKTWGWVITILGLAIAVSSFFLGHFIK